jgi:hypothetical protein
MILGAAFLLFLSSVFNSVLILILILYLYCIIFGFVINHSLQGIDSDWREESSQIRCEASGRFAHLCAIYFTQSRVA